MKETARERFLRQLGERHGVWVPERMQEPDAGVHSRRFLGRLAVVAATVVTMLPPLSGPLGASLGALKKVIQVVTAEGLMGKPWWRSKTVWANLLAVAGVFLSQFAGIDLGAEVQAEILVIIMGVVNLVLRFRTTEPITGGGEPA